jgi:hypothetical protein
LSAGLALALLSTSAWSQQLDFGNVQIITEQLGPNVYMLTGSAGLDPSHEDAAGGRIGVLAGPEGILMIDSQYAQLGDKVLAAIRRIDSGPIRFLVNTHIHRDHTAGNAYFAKQGAVIFAREELRDGMVRLSKAPNAGTNPVANPAGFPVVTYGMGPPVKIHIERRGGPLHPDPGGAPGGDTSIKFEKANVLFIGDFYRNYGYPFIDINNGGSLRGHAGGTRSHHTVRRRQYGDRPGPRHADQARRHRALSRDDPRGHRQGARDDPAGKTLQEVLAAKVTAPLRREGRGRHGLERRAVRQRRVSELRAEVTAVSPGVIASPRSRLRRAQA